LAQTSVITLKIQQHAVNARGKRLWQLSLKDKQRWIQKVYLLKKVFPAYLQKGSTQIDPSSVTVH